MKKIKVFGSVVTIIVLLLLSVAPAFALGEDLIPPPAPADTTAPAISAVVAASITSVAASISWVTDELSSSTFEYGTSTSYGSSASVSGGLAIGGTVALTGLTAGTTYHYCIHATDASNNAASSCGHSFATSAAPSVADTSAPTILAAVVASTGSTTATVTWTTSELASSQVEYGTTTSYGQATTLDTSVGLTHSVSLTGLNASTLYHYRIKSADASSNLATSADATFSTSAGGSGQVQVNDTTPPTVSGVAEASLSNIAATIAWTTDELATSVLRYGTTTGYGSTASINAGALLVHTGTILNLSPSTTYYYCIDATDLFTNVSHSCGHTFTTAATPSVLDNNPPVVSSVVVASITTTSATVSWITDEASNGVVQYGTTASYGSTAGTDTDYTLADDTVLSGLTPNTLYHYRVRTTDAESNVSYTTDNTFTTAAVSVQNQTTVTVISGVTPSPVTTTTATINWATDLPSDSQVQYGTSTALGSATSLNTALTTSHSVVITGLTPNTNYTFKVLSKAVGASIASASPLEEFTTLAEQIVLSTPAVISTVASSSVASASATVTWNTDKAASTQVEYGISTAYGQSTVLNASMGTSHSVALSDLAPSTTYDYRVKSVDSDGNISYSDNHTFTTAASVSNNSSVVAAPSAINNVSVISTDSHEATLSWNVATAFADTANQYDIRYGTSPITESNFANASAAQSTAIDYVDLQPNGTGRSYVIAGLTPGATYHFALKSKQQTSIWSAISNVPTITLASVEAPVVGTGAGGSAVTVSSPAAPVRAPTLVNASGDDGQIILNWINPSGTNYVRTVVVRKDGGYPTSPIDGQTLYEGRSTTFTDTPVTNGTKYYYAIYSYNDAKAYSSPVRVSLAPNGARNQVTISKTPSLALKTAHQHFITVFKKGDAHIEIEHLQQILDAEGEFYPDELIDGKFGSLTEKGLKAFQAKHRLPQTGITDAATQAILNNVAGAQVTLQAPAETVAYSRDLKYGQRGDDVKNLQQLLTQDGSYAGPVDGQFGYSTQKAVRTFQRKSGVVPVTGVVGYKTRHVLESISGF